MMKSKTVAASTLIALLSQWAAVPCFASSRAKIPTRADHAAAIEMAKAMADDVADYLTGRRGQETLGRPAQQVVGARGELSGSPEWQAHSGNVLNLQRFFYGSDVAGFKSDLSQSFLIASLGIGIGQWAAWWALFGHFIDEPVGVWLGGGFFGLIAAVATGFGTVWITGDALVDVAVGMGNRRAEARLQGEFFSRLRERGMPVPHKNPETWLKRALTERTQSILNIQTAEQLSLRLQSLAAAADEALATPGLTEVQREALTAYRAGIPAATGLSRRMAPRRWLLSNLLPYAASRDAFLLICGSLGLTELGFDAAAALAQGEHLAVKQDSETLFWRVFEPQNSFTADVIRGREEGLGFESLENMADFLAQSKGGRLNISIKDPVFILPPAREQGVPVGVAELRVRVWGAVGDEAVDRTISVQFNTRSPSAADVLAGNAWVAPLAAALDAQVRAWLKPVGYRDCARQLDVDQRPALVDAAPIEDAPAAAPSSQRQQIKQKLSVK